MRSKPEWNTQVAIITGGGSGLGRAIAVSLRQKGVEVVLFDLDEEGMRETAALCGGDGVQCCTVDATNLQGVQESVDRIGQERDRIDILVNCAGITGQTHIKSALVDAEDFHHVMEVNLFGSFNTFRAVIAHMLRRNYGRILHMASIAGKEGNAGMLAYSSSKAAVIGMTKVQGKEYAETGVTVNALAPAVVRTPLVDQLPLEQVTYMTDRIPMKRCGSLEEVATLATFIVSPENSFTTAFVYDMSGGRATY